MHETTKIHFNKIINDKIKNQEGVNFLSLIHYANSKVLSITAKYDDLENRFYNSKEEVSFDDFYYGLHPNFDNSSIHEIVVNRLFKKPNDLNIYVDKNYREFMLYDGLQKYIKPLHKKVILQAIHKFGIECYYEDQDTFDYIKKHLNLLNNKQIKFTNYNDPFYMLGSISDNTLNIFKSFQIKFFYEKEKIIVSTKRGGNFNFNNVSVMKDNYRLVYGDAFYSGVMLKLMRIDQLPNKYSNRDVDSLMLTTHRTTFFTEDAFDNHTQNDNSLLEDSDINNIEEFFNNEDKRQSLLIDKSPNISINEINEYLEVSTFPNIIGVTANLTTLDDMLILCKRGRNVEDAFTLYPSVNGHAEFYDSNVAFYKESAYEDVPTILANTNNRIDFEGEIARETTAELNINEFKHKWQYSGISVLAIKPKEGNVKRRFHFNILMKNQVNHTAAEVIAEHNKAVEKFENEKLYMVNLKIYKSFMDKIISKFWIVIQWITKNQSMLGIFATVMVIILTTSFIQAQDTLINKLISSPFESLMLVFSVILSLRSIIHLLAYTKKYYKHLKYVNKINTNDFSRNISTIISKTQKKINKNEVKNIILSPITLVMYSIYIHNQLDK